MATDTSLRHPEISIGESVLSEQDKSRSVALIELVVILAERKRLILTITVGCTLLAVAIAFLLPVRYTATLILLPPQESTSVGSTMAAQLSSLGGMAALAGSGLGLKNPNDMYVTMLKTRNVEDAMIRDFGLQQEYHDRYMSDARKDLERHFDIDASQKDGLIHISVYDHDPRRAAAMANGYVDRFRNLTEHLAITEASQRRLFFEQQLQSAKDQLAEAEEALKDTEQKTGMIQLDSQARALIESAASLRAQIAAKEVQIQAMQTYENGQNADLVQARQELDGLREQLAKLGGAQSGDGELIMPKGAVPEAGLEYVRRVRDVKYYETMFDILARQYEMAKLDEAREGALIQVVDPATPPDKKSSPKRGLILAVSAAAGVFLGMFFAVLADTWDRFRRDPEGREQVEMVRAAFRAPVLPRGQR
jgi:tyrosine-protein kinase Etk/Wzc